MALDFLFFKRELIIIRELLSSFDMSPAINVDVLWAIYGYNPSIAVRTTRMVHETGEVPMVGCIDYLKVWKSRAYSLQLYLRDHRLFWRNTKHQHLSFHILIPAYQKQPGELKTSTGGAKSALFVKMKFYRKNFQFPKITKCTFWIFCEKSNFIYCSAMKYLLNSPKYSIISSSGAIFSIAKSPQPWMLDLENLIFFLWN